MFASTISNRPVAVSQPINPQKQMIEFKGVPLKQLYHLSIFMLPNVQFDPDYTALIYYEVVPEKKVDSGIASNVDTQQIMQGGFKLLGFLNAAKQSAIFKINPGNINIPVAESSHDEGDIDMESGISEREEQDTVSIVIGVSIELNSQATQQLDCLRVTRNVPAITSTKSISSSEKAILNQNDILTVSNKIIANAYNYLSSFTDERNNVNINKFNDWWDKFKQKMNHDPTYLQNLE